MRNFADGNFAFHLAFALLVLCKSVLGQGCVGNNVTVPQIQGPLTQSNPSTDKKDQYGSYVFRNDAWGLVTSLFYPNSTVGSVGVYSYDPVAGQLSLLQNIGAKTDAHYTGSNQIWYGSGLTIDGNCMVICGTQTTDNRCTTFQYNGTWWNYLTTYTPPAALLNGFALSFTWRPVLNAPYAPSIGKNFFYAGFQGAGTCGAVGWYSRSGADQCTFTYVSALKDPGTPCNGGDGCGTDFDFWTDPASNITYMAVGCPAYDASGIIDSGGFKIFKQNSTSTGWSMVGSIYTPPSPVSSGNFGAPRFTELGVIFVSEFLGTCSGYSKAGKMHMYIPNGDGTWTRTLTFCSPNPSAGGSITTWGAQYGISFAYMAGHLVVGEPQSIANASDYGKAWHYSVSSSNGTAAGTTVTCADAFFPTGASRHGELGWAVSLYASNSTTDGKNGFLVGGIFMGATDGVQNDGAAYAFCGSLGNCVAAPSTTTQAVTTQAVTTQAVTTRAVSTEAVTTQAVTTEAVTTMGHDTNVTFSGVMSGNCRSYWNDTLNGASSGTVSFTFATNWNSAIDNVNAASQSSFAKGTTSYNLYVANCSFSLPSTTLNITGITVNLTSQSSQNQMQDNSMRLMKSAVPVTATEQCPGACSQSNTYPTTMTTRMFGTPTSLWGTSWNYSTINDPGFGFVYRTFYTRVTGSATATLSIDLINITVYYTYYQTQIFTTQAVTTEVRMSIVPV
jgi:hypothetical protein